ncbi:MAG: phenyltransferase domain-containing protein [Desulfobacteraceae bacterium]
MDLTRVAAQIASTQRKNGEIPWWDEGKTDPWDHVEAAMGLTIGGYLAEARNAYEWTRRMQHAEGSWYAGYMNSVPTDKTRETNLVAYVAVGVFHYYLITKDTHFLNHMWPTVRAAIDFVLSFQISGGEIHWAISPQGKIDYMALLTGCSSIYFSLKCAVAIANLLNHNIPAWKIAQDKLKDAINHRPYAFNMTKSRFSMDWFYPILAGAILGDTALKRIKKYWKKFVVENMGVRCVSDQPWITIAETSELVIALTAMGKRELAEIVFGWISDRIFDDGSFWCGFTIPQIILWPEEKLTWTNAAVLLAADALYNLTPAGNMFSHDFWKSELSTEK